MSVLAFEGVHRAYERGADVLAGVDFSISKGEVVGLLGKNGAGKTTLIRIAMGMLEPQRGSVRVFGLDPRAKPLEVKRRVGYVSEDQILPPFLTVAEVVDTHRGLFPTWDDEMYRELANRFELSPRARIRDLSKGQARQVALLCAVSHRPELLVLDEPAGGLDPAARREFLETSIRLLNEAGTTILFSSHYMQDVERVAGRVVMLHGGSALIDDALDALREAHTLAVIPREDSVTIERVRAVAGCLGVRSRSDGLHAVFALAPEEACRRLSEELGAAGASCRSIALEDMFIELVGGQE
ncbi:ABC transporter ATP-binding protein [bacterium]|nr:ABC transporter ATP-binding protein [bacterium]